MYLPIEPQRSCADAWLAAVQRVDRSPNHEATNVILDVKDPICESGPDREVVSLVDSFLHDHNHFPVDAIANTIFPRATYNRHGAPAFYDVYLERIYPRVRRPQGDWGRYFQRMITFPLQRNGRPINPLDDIVEKMKRQVTSERCFKNVYELTIYDPIRDAGPVMNRQCLSFLSFKLTDDEPRKLLLTAMYRNHYYIERLLGNLIGLGRLMQFVASETGVSIGSLTILSTHAEIDSAASRPEIVELLGRCAAIVRKNQESGADGTSIPATPTQAHR